MAGVASGKGGTLGLMTDFFGISLLTKPNELTAWHTFSSVGGWDVVGVSIYWR